MNYVKLKVRYNMHGVRFMSATVPQSLDGAYAAVFVTPVLTCAATE